MRFFITISIFIITAPLSAQIVGLKETYNAGESITFYSTSKTLGLSAMITHSYGTNWIEGVLEENRITFKIPDGITKKKGTINITLIRGNTVYDKAMTVVTANKDSDRSIESYCGPKHLIVGISDFTMITTTVLDGYDNPYPTETPVEFKSNIESEISSQLNKMKGLLAFERFYAPSVKGYGAITSTYGETRSKEFRIDFYANHPEDFTISYNREHSYADGNQIVSFKTSKIKDQFSNTIENGTSVSFNITNDEGKRYYGTSETINGIANFQLPAPYKKMEWKVEASILGFAKSNQLEIEFLSSIKSLPFTTTEKTLIIGPLEGYMGQFTREGTPVSIILENKSNFYEFNLSTQSGYARLDYGKNLISDGTYNVIMKVADLEESTKITVEDDKK